MSKLRNSRNTLFHCVSQVRLQEDYDGLAWHQGFTSYMFNLAAGLHVEFVINGGTSTHFYLPTHQHSSATCLECQVATSDTVTCHSSGAGAIFGLSFYAILKADHLLTMVPTFVCNILFCEQNRQCRLLQEETNQIFSADRSNIGFLEAIKSNVSGQ